MSNSRPGYGRLSAVLLAALFLSLACSGAWAQAYPNRPVRVIVPFPPGGTLDIVARLLVQRLAEQTAQPFVLENRPGGNGTIGAAAVAKANADGYTLQFSASTFATSDLVMAHPPYRVPSDFTPIALVARAPLSVSINKQLPITDMAGLFGYARAHPGELSFAIGSAGSAGHLATELLKRSGGGTYLIVPYKGSAPAYQDLIGGAIAGFVDPVLGAIQYHKAGALRILAVTSAARLPTLPDIPTVSETLPGYEFTSWYALWGPARLPGDIVQRLNEEVNKALSSGLREKLLAQGLLSEGGSAAEFARFQQAYIAQSATLIRDANIHVE